MTGTVTLRAETRAHKQCGSGIHKEKRIDSMEKGRWVCKIV